MSIQSYAFPGASRLLLPLGLFATVLMMAQTRYAAPQQLPSQSPDQMQAAILSKMHQTNQMEIQAGQLAKSKGGTFEVRAFGDRLVRDHKKADAMVESFANLHHLALMPQPPMTLQQQQKMQALKSNMQELQGLSGAPFDQKFLGLMKKGHTMAISMLGMAHQKLAGTPLGSLVGKLIPILEQHYEIAATLDIRTMGEGGAEQAADEGGE